jgi:putative phosphoribosyl transferase
VHLRTPTPGQMPVPEPSAPAAPASARELRLDAGATLTGELILMPTHDGSGRVRGRDEAGRHSLRNRALAVALDRAGLATLPVDLLGDSERPRRRPAERDVELLAHRLAEVTRWAIGASAAAAAALCPTIVVSDEVARWSRSP